MPKRHSRNSVYPGRSLFKRVAQVPPSVVNGVLFNLSWLAIVYTQSNLLAPAIALFHLAVHMLYMGQGRGELLLVGTVFVTGGTLDQLLFAAGVFTLAGQHALAPLWLSCLWVILATTLLHAFAFLQGRWWLAAAMGAIGGCASYVAGARLTQVAFGSPLYGPMLIAALWALLMPLLLHVAAVFKLAVRDTGVTPNA